mgnify:CR=1 FL=1
MQPRPQSARDLYRSRLTLQAGTLAAIRRIWSRMGVDFDVAWAALGPQILIVLSAAQLQAAADAAAYVTLSTLEQGIEQDLAGNVTARAFAGAASDGRSLASLLSEAVILSKVNVARGASPREALAAGGSFLDLVTRTQIADAGRAAELVGMTANRAVGGVKPAAEILNMMGTAVETSVLDFVREADGELAQKIMDNMFTFDDMEKLEDKGVQALLKEVQSESLVIALKGAPPGLREKIYKNMSTRAAEALKEDLESRGPVRLSEVEAEQKEMLKIVRRLVEEGQIVLAGGGDEQLV